MNVNDNKQVQDAKKAPPAAAPTQVALTINGREVKVAPGATIMEAVKALGGVEVPHFCWHPGLSIAGVCRFCMVKVEGMPKLQIACNTPVREGMKVETQTDDVKDAHKWALEFHLINHPLDCPICDQAGECELQNYYMKVGKYDSQMQEDKVLKPKTLDVGDTLVLDTERCILCSRCVRFEDEVTKTSTLGIFNRGDRAVIGTYDDRRITHNYSYNLADICPVGAFTSKDFRFKCRVWFLAESESVCSGCSTGCNVTLYQNSNTREFFRLKPRENQDVNGHWMCDRGRLMFEQLNIKNRLAVPTAADNQPLAWSEAAEVYSSSLQSVKDVSQVALVLTPQFMNEDYELILDHVTKTMGKTPKIYIWREATEKRDDFDGLLLRGDRNPNTAGLKAVLAAQGHVAQEIKGLADLGATKPALTLVFGPEDPSAYPSLAQDLGVLAELPKVVYFGNTIERAASPLALRIPVLTYAEKEGTFVNHAGKAQRLKPRPGAKVIPSLKSLADFFAKTL
jgi:NADH-quinone oxidoreductase subunit G